MKKTIANAIKHLKSLSLLSKILLACISVTVLELFFNTLIQINLGHLLKTAIALFTLIGFSSSIFFAYTVFKKSNKTQNQPEDSQLYSSEELLNNLGSLEEAIGNIPRNIVVMGNNSAYIIKDSKKEEKEIKVLSKEELNDFSEKGEVKTIQISLNLYSLN